MDVVFVLCFELLAKLLEHIRVDLHGRLLLLSVGQSARELIVAAEEHDQGLFFRHRILLVLGLKVAILVMVRIF